MTNLDNREKAFENKFAHEEEIKFKTLSRKRKLLGLWAAETMGLSEEESLSYAISIVQLGIENSNPTVYINKIIDDMNARGLGVTESQVRLKSDEFAELAKRQILSEKK